MKGWRAAAKQARRPTRSGNSRVPCISPTRTTPSLPNTVSAPSKGTPLDVTQHAVLLSAVLLSAVLLSVVLLSVVLLSAVLLGEPGAIQAARPKLHATPGSVA